MTVNLTAESDDFSYSEIKSANVTITKAVLTDSTGKNTTISSTSQTIDLMSDTNGGLKQLAQLSMSPATYNSLTLTISAASLDLWSGSHVALTVPAADSTTGLVIPIGPSVTLASGGKAQVLADFSLLDNFQATVDGQGNVSSWKYVPTAFAADQSQTGNISGVIFSNMGTPKVTTDDLPLAGALIELRQNGTLIATGVSQFGGTYSVIGLAPGNYDITASDQSGYTASSLNGTSIAANSRNSLNFTLGLTSGAVYGSVVSGSFAVSGALVSLIEHGTNAIIATNYTDSNGSYYFDDLGAMAANSYTISVTDNGYTSKSENGPVVAKGIASKATTLSLILTTGSYVGTVTDASSGYPIWDATVTISQNNTWIATTYTGTNGSYSVAGLQPGSYDVQVSDYGYNSLSVYGVPVVAGTTTLENFALLQTTGALTGHVTDSGTGYAIPGATVTVSQNGWQVAWTTANSNGHYWISGLDAGNYDISVTAYGYNTASVSYYVYAGQTGVVDFPMSVLSGSLGGTITDNQTGYSVSGAAVTISQNGFVVANTTTAYDGSYSVDWLSPGSYDIAVSAYGFNDGSDSAYVSGGSTTYDNIGLDETVSQGASGSIAGTITDYSTGYTISGATVTAYQNGFSIESVGTDDNGFYDLSGLAPGTYDIIVTADGYSDQEVDGETVYASQTTNQDVSM